MSRSPPATGLETCHRIGSVDQTSRMRLEEIPRYDPLMSRIPRRKRRSTLDRLDIGRGVGRGWHAHTAGVLIGAIVLVGAALTGCGTPSSTAWPEISKGMSAEEVEQVLGRPSSTHVVPEDMRDTVGYASWWQYGDRLSTLATTAVFPGQPDERVWVVFFDDTGHVIRMREPIERAEAFGSELPPGARPTSQ